MKNAHISTKLYASFGILIVLLIAQWMLGRWGMALYQEGAEAAFKGNVKVMEHASRARSNALGLRRYEKDMFLNIDAPKNVEKYLKSWSKEKDSLNERFADLEKVAFLPEDRKALTEMKGFLKEYEAGFAKTLQKIQSGEITTPQEANREIGSVKEATHQLVDKAKNLSTEAEKRVAADREGLEQLSARIGGITLALSVLALVAGIVSALLITRAIATPLMHMRDTIVRVQRDRDFTLRVPIETRDEVGETAHAFNDLLVALQQTFGQVLQSAQKVSDAANSLSSASKQVAAGSAQQSEATSAMAAAVEEMTVSINHVSDNARAALEASRRAGRLSMEGGEVIQKTAGEMTETSNTVSNASHAIAELGEQSNRISSIVQVIKEVADQTNLLALNAAIEAARAGEQGRGFAVVADEVRKLAERTTQATGEITQMISAIQQGTQAAISTMGAAVDQVGTGVSLANQAGSAIVEIKAGADQVIDAVNEISTALAEQSTTSNEIAGRVENVAQMTEENSSAAAESASAANRLQDSADELRAAVERFRI